MMQSSMENRLWQNLNSPSPAASSLARDITEFIAGNVQVHEDTTGSFISPLGDWKSDVTELIVNSTDGKYKYFFHMIPVIKLHF